MTTMIDARVPGTHCGWTYKTNLPVNIERWMGFLRNRGFTEIVKMCEEIPFIFTCPSGAECTRGWFAETDE